MTNLTALVGELEAMLAKATPELFNAKPERIAQMLRDGARAQRPLPDNINSFDGLADGALIVAAVNALPTLLAALKARGYMADTLVKLRADLAEEDAEIHAQRIAVIDDTLARASIEGNPTA